MAWGAEGAEAAEAAEAAGAAPVEGGEGADGGGGGEEMWAEGAEEGPEGEGREEETGHVPEFEHGAVTAGDEVAPSRPNLFGSFAFAGGSSRGRRL